MPTDGGMLMDTSVDPRQCEGLTPQEEISGGWRTLTPFEATAGNAVVEFWVRVTGNHGVLGVASGAATAYADLTANVRFGESGLVEVRDGAGYDADASVPYASGEWIGIRMILRGEERQYDVWAARCDDGWMPVKIGARYRGATDAQVSHLAMWADENDAIEVSPVSWTLGACEVRSCSELGAECGDMSDGCGGTLQCGGCAGPQICTAAGRCSDPASQGSWPLTATSALSRSSSWNPSQQVIHRGTYQTSTAGERVENLHIVDGRLIIAHDNVTVRNVEVEGIACQDGGNYLITFNQGVTGADLEGVAMGAPSQCWDNACGLPVFPTTGILAFGQTQFSIRACTTRHVGDSFKFLPGGGVIDATIEDCFTEIAQGIWEVNRDSCQADHCDGIQMQGSGTVNLTVRRTWLDAVPYQAASAVAPVVREELGIGTGVQVSSGVGGVMTFDTVRFEAGNVSLNFAGGMATLSVIDSVARDKGAWTIAFGENVVTDRWAGNRYAAGGDWLRP